MGLRTSRKASPSRMKKPFDGHTVYLLTTGSGDDGDEWNVLSIHRTECGARIARANYETTRCRPDGSTYTLEASIEEWDVNE